LLATIILINNLYRSPSIIRVIKSRRLAGHVARMEDGRNPFKVSTDKITRSPRRRWEDNIIMNPREIGINTRNWVDSAHGRGYWRVLVNFRILPLGSIIHGTSYYSYINIALTRFYKI
jgi:hypothetical protein